MKRMGSPWAAPAEAEGIQPLEGRAMLARVDKVRACHRHHRAPRIVFVGISPTAGRISCRGGGCKSLEGTLVSHVGRYLAPPPARMAWSPRSNRRRWQDTRMHTYPSDLPSMHTTYCVSLSTSFEAFTELSAATVGSGLPHALAEAEGAVPRRQALCRGEGYKSLEGTRCPYFKAHLAP